MCFQRASFVFSMGWLGGRQCLSPGPYFWIWGYYVCPGTFLGPFRNLFGIFSEPFRNLFGTFSEPFRNLSEPFRNIGASATRAVGRAGASAARGKRKNPQNKIAGRRPLIMFCVAARPPGYEELPMRRRIAKGEKTVSPKAKKRVAEGGKTSRQRRKNVSPKAKKRPGPSLKIVTSY